LFAVQLLEGRHAEKTSAGLMTLQASIKP
jgi:hypothetical protein